MRIGQGYDIHRLAPGEGIVLGGVHIPCALAVVAHSDGDVLLHAICDALLGAAALGDIGQHFPDTDPQYAGADSLILLKQVGALLKEKGFVVNNLDATIIAEQPKCAPHSVLMQENIAKALGLAVGQVNVKATTHEKLDAVGRGEAIACTAVALINSI